MLIESRDISRTLKFFTDRDDESPECSEKRLRAQRLSLVVGPEAARSATMQAAVLTIANLWPRVFLTRVNMTLHDDPELVVPWPHTDGRPTTLGEAVAEQSGDAAAAAGGPTDHVVVIGSGSAGGGAVRVTFDGWTALVGPAARVERLLERDSCVLAGVLAGALAIGEIFAAFARINPEACGREVGLSLWRPDIDWRHAEAVGPTVRYLPAECWLLGLGHLGQAFVWCLGLLPYEDPHSVRVMLNDSKRVAAVNLGTQVLTKPHHIGMLKTRVAEEHLTGRGLSPARLDRPFTGEVALDADEPRLALCGFDGSGPRHLLGRPGFRRVVECGLGGGPGDFDTVRMHALPHPKLDPERLWPQTANEDDARARWLAANRKHYLEHGRRHGCGELLLAGKAVAVPYVGCVAAALGLAEVLRELHGGRCLESLSLSVEDVASRRVRMAEDPAAPSAIRAMNAKALSRAGVLRPC